MRALLAVVAILLLVPVSAGAAATGPSEPDSATVAPARLPEVTRLLSPSLRPSTRDDLVSSLSDPTRTVPATELDRLLDASAPWEAQIDGARIAERRADPDWIPSMLRAFAASKLGTLRADPDIHERLLFTLEAMPRSAVRRELEEMSMRPVVDAAWERLSRSVAPLRGDGSEDLAGLSPDDRRRLTAGAALRRTLLDLLDPPDGLAALRHTRDDALLAFFDSPDAVGLLVGSDRGASALRRELGRQQELRTAAREVDRSGGRSAVERPTPTSPPAGDWELARPALPSDSLATPLRLVSLLFLLLLVGLVFAARDRRARRWAFPLAAVLLGLGALPAAEVVLSILGAETLSESRPNFSLGGEQSGERWFDGVELEGAAHRGSRKNNSRRQAFSEQKRKGTRRIGVLGGSSVRGVGLLREEAWPARLGTELEACSDPRPIEVVNAGADGALSDQLVGVADELLPFDFDLLVVYTGYNDFVFVPLLTRFQAFDPEDLRLRYELGRLRTTRLLARAIPERPAKRGEGAGFLDETDASEADLEPLRRTIGLNLRDNLVRIARRARAAGTEVLFVAQAQNEDICGEGSLAGQEPWDRTCFPRDARQSVLRAAREADVPVVDGAAALRATAGGSVGRPWFWDEIHPDVPAHAVLGAAVAPAAARLLGVEGCGER